VLVIWAMQGGALRAAHAHAPGDPTLRDALDQVADQPHPVPPALTPDVAPALAPPAPAVSSPPPPATAPPHDWNATTVRRLAAWANGTRDAASAAEVNLLIQELRRPVALIISGAASLGSYQGGFLYYYLRHLMGARLLAERVERAVRAEAAVAGTAPEPPWFTASEGSPLRLITGASSGSINAFIAAMASCQAPVRHPRDSLFFRTWFPVGGAALTTSAEVQPDGLFSTQPIRAAVARMQEAWNQGAWAPDRTCAVDVGLSATRIRSRAVAPLVGTNLTLPHQTEQLMFTMHGAPGQIPTIQDFVPEAGAPDKALFHQLFRLIAPSDRPLAVADITNILWASSAFSFAFPPHRLTLTPGDSSPPDDGDYTDGGVFDNRPAGLAVHMQRWRLGVAGEVASHTRYVVQDPDVTAWRPSRPAAVAPPAPGAPKLFLDTWAPFAGDFLDSAFTAELMDAIAREPTLQAGIEIPPRRMPVAGGYLMEFLAFAERDFRVFDFFSGMVDAWLHLAGSSLAFQVMAATGETPTFDDQAPEFDCLLAWRAHQLVGGAGATAPDDACAAVGREAVDPVLRDNLPALVHASTVALAWSTRPAPHAGDASDEEVFLRALGDRPATPGRAPYRFRDLTYRGKPATAQTVTLAIRDVMQELIERATFQQDGAGRFVVGAVGKALANLYAYRPPSVFAGMGLSTDRGLELQGGLRLPWTGWWPPVLDLRLDAVLRLLDLHMTVIDQPPERQHLLAFTYMAAAHVTNEWQLQRWFPQLQTALQLHTGVGWAVESLQTFNGPLLWRHGPELIAGASLLQRVTLEVSATFFQDDCAGNNHCAHASSPIADRPTPLVDGDFALRVALGYRFYLN